MKKALRLTLIAAAALLCATQAGAAQTNLVQNILLKLTLYERGGVTVSGDVIKTNVDMVKASTLHIISVLGQVTTNNFSPSAKLQLITPLPDGDPSVVVRDGTTVVDVSEFLDFDEIGDFIEASQHKISTGVSKGAAYGIIRLRLRDVDGYPELNTHFDVRGFVTAKFASIVSNGAVIGEVQQINANLAGTGEYNDKDFVGQVMVIINGRSLEVVP